MRPGAPLPYPEATFDAVIAAFGIRNAVAKGDVRLDVDHRGAVGEIGSGDLKAHLPFRVQDALKLYGREPQARGTVGRARGKNAGAFIASQARRAHRGVKRPRAGAIEHKDHKEVAEALKPAKGFGIAVRRIKEDAAFGVRRQPALPRHGELLAVRALHIAYGRDLKGCHRYSCTTSASP